MAEKVTVNDEKKSVIEWIKEKLQDHERRLNELEDELESDEEDEW